MKAAIFAKLLYLEAFEIKRSGSLPRAKHHCPWGGFNSDQRLQRKGKMIERKVERESL